MKIIKLVDPYREMIILMCEKHFRQYKEHMNSAVLGGTTYTFEHTKKRGCQVCARKRGKND